MATPPDPTPGQPAVPAGAQDVPAGSSAFQVHLDNFTGPFDLLLGLIAKHKLDITEVALAEVTDEFIEHIRAAERRAERTGTIGAGWDLSQASEFLVVAATLLDLKAARLLPSGEVEDDEDLELLEVRDLLFARLLQYRAYKVVAGDLGTRLAEGARRHPRTVELEPHLAALLPELVWQIGPDELAVLAAKAMAPPSPPPGVDVSHLHAPPVSVGDQAQVIADRLRRHTGAATFRALVADAGSTLVVVARFLALLELFRDGVVGFDQVTPLGELTVRWTGAEDEVVQVGSDFDEDDDPALVDDPAEPVTVQDEAEPEEAP